MRLSEREREREIETQRERERERKENNWNDRLVDRNAFKMSPSGTRRKQKCQHPLPQLLSGKEEQNGRKEETGSRPMNICKVYQGVYFNRIF